MLGAELLSHPVNLLSSLKSGLKQVEFGVVKPLQDPTQLLDFPTTQYWAGRIA